MSYRAYSANGVCRFDSELRDRMFLESCGWERQESSATRNQTREWQ